MFILWIKDGDYHPLLTTTLPGSGRDLNTEHSGASPYSNPLHYQSTNCLLLLFLPLSFFYQNHGKRSLYIRQYFCFKFLIFLSFIFEEKSFQFIFISRNWIIMQRATKIEIMKCFELNGCVKKSSWLGKYFCRLKICCFNIQEGPWILCFKSFRRIASLRVRINRFRIKKTCVSCK